MRRNMLLVFAFICVGLLSVMFVAPVFFPYQITPLEKFTWDQEPNIIALRTPAKDGKDGLMTIRLSDGKEQQFKGEWNTNFTDSNNVFVYKRVNTGPHSFFYYIEQGRKITTINIGKIAGDILSIQENPSGSYFAIEMELRKNKYYCVVEKIGTDKPSCKQLGVGIATQALWNPTKEHELVIQTPGTDIITYDPWAGKPITVDKESDPGRHQELTNIFVNTPDTHSSDSATGKQTIIQFLSILIIKNNTSFSVLSIPLFSRVAFLRDGNHIIVKAPHELSVVEYKTRKKNILQAYRDESSVMLRNKGRDVSL